MNKLVFIIGMRRSGTSILRELIMSHPEVYDIKFEPYELWTACQVAEIKRYRNNKYFNEVKESYFSYQDKWYGAKFALNAGIEAMNWKCLNREFPEAKFIFIIRNPKDTYASWIKADKNNIRGIIPYEMYLPWHIHINNSFLEFDLSKKEQDLNKTTIIYYEDLILNADKEMNKVWTTLEVEPIENLNRKIHKPENWSIK